MLNASAKLRVNSVKHLLALLINSFDQNGKVKSRFFVATLLRMTHDSKVFVGCALRTGDFIAESEVFPPRVASQARHHVFSVSRFASAACSAHNKEVSRMYFAQVAFSPQGFQSVASGAK
jgi:hypothetical protein